jgi:deoxyribose-phosphate aldolase
MITELIPNSLPLLADNKVFENININTYNVKAMANDLRQRFHGLDTETTIQELVFAIRSIDLTTLSGDDTDANVQRLCYRAVNPLRRHLTSALTANHKLWEPLTTAAVCVYPSRAGDCVEALTRLATDSGADHRVSIACVATGFPSGQYSLDTRLQEIEWAVKGGAHEIDVVVDRALALNGLWSQMSDELMQMKRICDRSGAHLKVIISAGELGSLDNVYKVCHPVV